MCESLRDGERGLLLPTTVPGQPEKSPPACFVNAGFTFASDGPGIHGRAPALAEHTGEVLKALGYSDSEIAALAASRAVQLAP